jgi:hypothetical protein
MSKWLLSLRRQSYTTVLVHHAGKRLLDGTLRQRGASKREDLMDAVIQIDKTASPRGGRVPLRWKYEKCRSFTPDEAQFDFSVVFDDAGSRAWLEEGNYQCAENEGTNCAPPPSWLPLAKELQDQGVSIRNIAIKCDASKSAVHRWLTGRAFTISDLGPTKPVPLSPTP